MQKTDPHARVPREAILRFYAELNDFLPEARRQREFPYRFSGTPSVKDTIEAIGVPHTEVDVILVDVEMPGMSGLAALSAMDDHPPAIVVTMHAADDYGASAQEAGAKGFLSKGLPLPELAAAIRAVDDGMDLFDADHEDLAAYRSPRLSVRAEAITDRERDVLRCLVQGISATDDIADELYISQKTVKNHLASIYEKLGVNDRAQAVVEAMKLGLDRDWA